MLVVGKPADNTVQLLLCVMPLVAVACSTRGGGQTGHLVFLMPVEMLYISKPAMPLHYCILPIAMAAFLVQHAPEHKNQQPACF